MKPYCAAVLLTVFASQATAEEPNRAPLSNVDQSTARAIAILKKMQQENGSWENNEAVDRPKAGDGRNAKGIITSLALLALLENGIPNDDPAILSGLKILREVDLVSTYLVCVQTMALCKANLPQDRKLIQRNVKWLLGAASRPNNQLQGWGDVKHPVFRTDYATTFFAIMALHAAHQVDCKIDDQWWKDIRAYYLLLQQRDGSWGFSFAARQMTSRRPTMAGICGLLIADRQLDGANKESTEAVAKGFSRLLEEFQSDPKGIVLSGEMLLLKARLGLLSGKKKFDGKKSDSFHSEATTLLKRQNPDGSFSFGLEKEPSLGTAYALLFLAAGK